ncbi:MAG: hypothetical protein KDC12_09830 [Flavobacteriales bacterium]|nr:hypothetical protein [Flavobacteriales bacterium]
MITTYNVEEGEKTVVSQEWYDDDDRLIKRVDFHLGEPFLATLNQYDDQGRLAWTQEELTGGDTVDTYYEYDGDRLILTRKVHGETVEFEERIIESEGVTDIIRLAQGQISERVHRESRSDNEFYRWYYNAEDQLVEKHHFIRRDAWSELIIEDESGEMAVLEVCMYDDQDNIILKMVHNSTNAMVYREEIMYNEAGDIESILAFDASADVIHTISMIEYDDDGRFLENEVTDLYGKTLEFIKQNYNDLGEITEVIYFKPFAGDIARQIGDGEPYHLVME